MWAMCCVVLRRSPACPDPLLNGARFSGFLRSFVFIHGHFWSLPRANLLIDGARFP